MARGFGKPKEKQQKTSKAAPQKKSRPLLDLLPEPVVKQKRASRDCPENLMDEYARENPEEMAALWEIGVYNPLADYDPTHSPSFEEENWLFLAHAVGFFTFDEGFADEALYWTAPPPRYSPRQADWYVRPDLTHALEEPMRLKDVVQRYPISREQLEAAVYDWKNRLGWNEQQLTAFIDKQAAPGTTISTADPIVLAVFVCEMKELFYGDEG